MLAINDGFADGRDLSWLWDVAIEDIAPGAFVLCTGVRAADMALRFKYAGVHADVVPDIGEGIVEFVRRTPPGERPRCWRTTPRCWRCAPSSTPEPQSNGSGMSEPEAKSEGDRQI